MKKLALVCALICVGQLYGMEKEEAVAIYMSPLMLPEIKQQILNAALASSENIDEAIDAIKKFSMLHSVQFDKFFNNLQTFIKVVNLLSQQSPELTKSAIAEKLNPSLAKEYNTLNEKLIEAIRYHHFIGDIIQLLNQGADVNFYWDTGSSLVGTPLTLAITGLRPDLVELLLNSGANPFFKFPSDGMTALDVLHSNQARLAQSNIHDFDDKLKAMKALLEQAMQKK